MRILRNQTFNADEYGDVNFLYSGKLIDIPNINQAMTYLYGKSNANFPLQFTTEGQGAINQVKPKKLNDTQYAWDVMGKLRLTSKVVGLVNTNLTKPGLNFTEFEVEFEDSWFIPQYGATTPDGNHNVRLQRKGSKANSYIITISSGNSAEYIAATNFVSGSSWVMTAPAVPVTKSDGNRNNRQAPGKLLNQYGLYRYSMNIAGNYANKVVSIKNMPTTDGKKNLWMPEEMHQFDILRRTLNEAELWYSKYNRDEFGVVTEIDDATDEVVPRGAGIKQIIEEGGNYSTYTTLTLQKIEDTINRIFTEYQGDSTAEIMVYTGRGGMMEFNNAIKNDANGRDYFTKLSDVEIKEMNGGLRYGNYFNSFKTIDGKIVTFVESNMFNKGPRAEMDRANGRILNGVPYESYNMVFLDQSASENGERNIQLVTEEGRENISKIYPGMASLPKEWKAAVPKDFIADRRDIASYEIMESRGINMYRSNTCFWWEKDFA